MRQVDHDKRERLQGLPLRCHALYDSAEILRRYLERYHDCALFEEDDVRHGPRGPAVKKQLYGSTRIATPDLKVRRRIAREFGVDAQPRVIWVIEGRTEEGFITRLARHYFDQDMVDLGIELVRLDGVSQLTNPDRLKHYVLERAARDEVFVFVSVDRERKDDHVAKLHELAEQGLLRAGFQLWEYDFEQNNFTDDELATVASGFARKLNCSAVITSQEIADTVGGDGPRGSAIEDLWKTKCRCEGRNPPKKGKAWGTTLAEWVLEHDDAEDEGTESGGRLIVDTLFRLVRTTYADYPLTTETTVVDSDGQVISKPAQKAGANELLAAQE